VSYFDDDHPTHLSDALTSADHRRGPVDAAVTVVEYGDFACPFCGQAYRMVKTLLAERPDLALVFRANPRSHLFPRAEIAAEAAEAAGAQGKFWEMHDLLFENQGSLSRREELSRLARTLGLDMERFDREVDGGVYRSAIHRQEISGWHSHVLQTPTFFVNGVRLEDAPDTLPAAVSQVARKERLEHKVYREARVQSTTDRRRQVVSVGPHVLTADLAAADGGQDAGPSPTDLLVAALGACTAMTVQFAAEKSRLPLRGVDVRVSQSRTPDGQLFRVQVALDGDLDEDQRARLQRAADHCPVARILTGEIAIDTRVTVERTVDEAGEETFPASDPPPWTLGREPPR